MGMNENFFLNITSVVEEYGKVIVLEDDICTAPQFLTYMNDALDFYENEERVMQISGFVFNISNDKLPHTYFVGMSNGWGWGTWKSKWSKLNRNAKELFEIVQSNSLYHRMTLDGAERDFWNQLEANAKGVNNDWDIKWFSTVIVNNGLCLYPKQSLVVNIGFDGTGIHFKNGEKGHETKLSNMNLVVEKIPVEESTLAREKFSKYFKSHQPTLIDKINFKLNLIKSKYLKK